MNGDVYEGDWSNDNTNGQGKCTYAKQDCFGRSWNIDMNNGSPSSQFYCPHDCYSEGEWKDGKFINGNARHQYSNGDQYIGEWRDGVKNGHGAYSYVSDDSNGRSVIDVYVGQFKEDKRHGAGRCTYADRDLTSIHSYSITRFHADMNNGSAICGYINVLTGCFSDGDWKDDKFFSGEAKHQYSNGEQYEGQWKDNGAQLYII